MKKKNIKISFFIIILIIIDQLIKFLVSSNMLIGESFVIINNFFKIIYIQNKGAAFGLFSNNFILLILITIVLIWYLIKEIKSNINNKVSIISFSLLISGALGNLLDRIIRGFVVDYISFTLFNHEMAVFNFADMCITFGVIMLIYIVVRGGYNEKNINRKWKCF